jgi:hypothetical protein
VSSPAHAGWFRVPATGHPRSDKPRPFGFGLLGHVDPFATHLVNEHPAAPYETRPRIWPQLGWYDRRTGQPVSVIGATELGADPDRLAEAIISGVVLLRTIGDILRGYDQRPEHKSLGPDGGLSGADTRGQLRRRPIVSAPELTSHIGKEGNKLIERATGEITDPDEYRTTYPNPEAVPWRALVLPVLRQMHTTVSAKQIGVRVGVTDRQVRNWIAGPDQPQPRNRERVEQVAAEWALASWSRPAVQFRRTGTRCCTPTWKPAVG